MNDRDAKMIEYYEERVRVRASAVAENLRSVADRIDRDVKNASVDAVASGVTHEVVWGVANSGLDTLAENYRNLVEMRAAVADDPDVAGGVS